MSLSPEERRRIWEEEKVRIEAHKAQRGPGCFVWFFLWWALIPWYAVGAMVQIIKDLYETLSERIGARKTMLVVGGATALVLAWFVTHQPSPTPPPPPSQPVAQRVAIVDDYAIVPGERIGVITLGMWTGAVWSRVYDAHKILPVREKSKTVAAESMCWPSLDLCAGFAAMDKTRPDTPTALSIVVKSSRYQTADGVHVGMSYREARRRLGKPAYYDRYPSSDLATWSGLEMEINKRGFIITIAVN